MADVKTLALLNGIAEIQYFNDEQVTEDSIRSEHFPDISMEEFDRLFSKMKYILSSMASSDMGLHQLEAFLASQVKKRENPINEDQSQSILKFWTNNKTKIHAALVKSATWNPILSSYHWRMVNSAQSQNSQGLAVPIALLEIHTENNLQNDKGTIRLEFDENSLSELLPKLDNVQQCLTSYCKT